MEEDDEIQSPAASGGSGSAETPRQNGRITVTVAAAPGQIPPPPSSQGQNKTLTLALPSQSQPPSQTPQPGKSSGGGREDCWSEAATAVLIEAWGERFLELSRGNLKQKHWKEVADVVFASGEDYGKVPKTDIQCKNRIDTVKKKYKLEKSKIMAGGGPSKWAFYDRMDFLIGPSNAKSGPGSSGGGGSGKSSKVPVGMPVGSVRSAPGFGKREVKIRPRGVVDWDSDESGDLSPFSIGDEVFERKRRKIPAAVAGRDGIANANANANAGGGGKGEKGGGGGGGWGSSVRELTRAILKFGEAYEHAETAKLQQVVEMEKQRMKFAKELELQRIQFFMKTQVEISQLKPGSGGGGGRRNGNGVGNASNHHGNNNNHNTTNSDCSN